MLAVLGKSIQNTYGQGELLGEINRSYQLSLLHIINKYRKLESILNRIVDSYVMFPIQSYRHLKQKQEGREGERDQIGMKNRYVFTYPGCPIAFPQLLKREFGSRGLSSQWINGGIMNHYIVGKNIYKVQSAQRQRRSDFRLVDCYLYIGNDGKIEI